MIITKYYCDHCGKEVTGDFSDTCEIDTPRKFYGGIILCSDCRNKLIEIIDEFVNNNKGE